MSSCFGSRKSRSDDREPLLPQYNDDTVMQRRLHEKLHSYQMVRALSKGFMPSTEQVIVNLRTLLSADILNPDEYSLSDSGRLLAKHTKQWLRLFIDMLQHKNSEDQVQDFIWFLSKSRLSVDVRGMANQMSHVKARADTQAAYDSLRTVGSLLLTNSDFRLFVTDLQTMGREIFKDSAMALSSAAEKVGNDVAPMEANGEASAVVQVDKGPAKTGDELANDLVDISGTVANGIAEVSKETATSAKEHLQGVEGETLMNRLKQSVLKLRQRNDYSDSVSTLSLLLKRYALLYSRAAEDVVQEASEDVHHNAETEIAVKNFWSLLTSFGSSQEWTKLEECFKKVAAHQERDPEFEKLISATGDSLQGLLTDPDFFDHANEKFNDLREKSKGVGPGSSLRGDINELLAQSQTTFVSVLNDADVANMIDSSMKILNILSPTNAAINKDLFHDALDVFFPLLIQAIQYIPIPRLEISVPEVDLLLENLIVEPGKTVNHSSFFPFRLRIETYNDLEIRKARMRTVSTVTSLVTIKLDGMSVRADEVGFWLRAHSGILRLADQGIASFQLDERGMDIHLDVELGEERLEKMISLKAVRVHIHKLNYTLRKSKFACLAWIFKPILRPIIRKVMEKQLATAIADFIHAANRELVYARERLRATRISDPKDLQTFVRAIITRLTPEDDPDMYTRVGIAQPGKGVFKGVYAPGSVVKVWNEEAAKAPELIDDFDRGGWKNSIFDVNTTTL